MFTVIVYQDDSAFSIKYVFPLFSNQANKLDCS